MDGDENSEEVSDALKRLFGRSANRLRDHPIKRALGIAGIVAVRLPNAAGPGRADQLARTCRAGGPTARSDMRLRTTKIHLIALATLLGS